MRDMKRAFDQRNAPRPANGGPATEALGALRGEIEKLLNGAADAQEMSAQYAALREQLMQILPALQHHAAAMAAQPDISPHITRLSAELSELRAQVGELSGKVDALSAQRAAKSIKIQHGADGRISGATVTEES